MKARLPAPNYVRKRQYLLHLLTTEKNPKGVLAQKWNNLPTKIRTYGGETAAIKEVHGALAETLPRRYVIRNGLKIVVPTEYRSASPNAGVNNDPGAYHKA